MLETLPVYDSEREKYRRVWTEVEAYRNISFGDQLVGPFLAMTGAKPGQSLVDVGCGTGRAGLKFANLLLDVALIDATVDALDPEVRAAVDDPEETLVFVETCIWRDWPRELPTLNFAYCCDVLEHIPQEFTLLVALRCLQAAQRAFFHINFEPDLFGRTIGTPLHLTVQPFTWWRDRLAELGHLTEARDLLGSGLFVLERS